MFNLSILMFIKHFQEPSNFPDDSIEYYDPDKDLLYFGQMQRGVFHGYGKARFVHSDDTWECQWVNGSPHGLMIFHAGDGRSFEGFILRHDKDGNAVELDGKITYPNGAFYEGHVRGYYSHNCHPHGPGKMTWSSGKTHEGIWKNGTKVR